MFLTNTNRVLIYYRPNSVTTMSGQTITALSKLWNRPRSRIRGIKTYVRSAVEQLIFRDGREGVRGPSDVVGVRPVADGLTGEARGSRFAWKEKCREIQIWKWSSPFFVTKGITKTTLTEIRFCHCGQLLNMQEGDIGKKVSDSFFRSLFPREPFREHSKHLR